VPDRPVKYADHPAPCADCLAMWTASRIVRCRSVTVPTQNGWKAIALSAGARQELFISTDLKKEKVEEALAKAGAVVGS